jgi:hypothetical protein
MEFIGESDASFRRQPLQCASDAFARAYVHRFRYGDITSVAQVPWPPSDKDTVIFLVGCRRNDIAIIPINSGCREG